METKIVAQQSGASIELVLMRQRRAWHAHAHRKLLVIAFGVPIL